MSPMEQLKRTRGWKRGAFTLVEMMISAALFGLVTAGSFGVYIMCQKLWRATTLSTDTARIANLAIERLLYGVDSNNYGLRSAASISVDTNHHTYFVVTNYWDTPGGSPPPANSSANDFAFSPLADGSWRITYSNAFEVVKWIDYVKKQRTIVMWPNTNDSASRLLIGNYVVDASAITNPMGIAIMVTTWKKDGNFVASNQASVVIMRRNN